MIVRLCKNNDSFVILNVIRPQDCIMLKGKNLKIRDHEN